MTLFEFALLNIAILVFIALYKGITFKKSMFLYAANFDKIKACDCDDKLKELLYFINDESVKSLFLLKALIGSLFFFKRGQIELNKLSKKNLNTYISFCLESIKTYFTYAPHWIPVFGAIGIILSVIFIMFSSIEKLKQVALKPIELRYLAH